MRIEALDEADSSWENHHPRFRVYLAVGDPPVAVSTDDIVDADVLDVIRWAQTEAGSLRHYAVALVPDRGSRPREHRRGRTWLLGTDPSTAPGYDHERSTLAARQAGVARRW